MGLEEKSADHVADVQKVVGLKQRLLRNHRRCARTLDPGRQQEKCHVDRITRYNKLNRQRFLFSNQVKGQ
jgi:hypothetical protein